MYGLKYMMIEFDNADVDEPFRVYMELDENGTTLLRKIESYRICKEFFAKIPWIRECLETDLHAAYDGDPAAGGKQIHKIAQRLLQRRQFIIDRNADSLKTPLCRILQTV